MRAESSKENENMHENDTESNDDNNHDEGKKFVMQTSSPLPGSLLMKEVLAHPSSMTFTVSTRKSNRLKTYQKNKFIIANLCLQMNKKGKSEEDTNTQDIDSVEHTRAHHHELGDAVHDNIVMGIHTAEGYINSESKCSDNDGKYSNYVDTGGNDSSKVGRQEVHINQATIRVHNLSSSLTKEPLSSVVRNNGSTPATTLVQKTCSGIDDSGNDDTNENKTSIHNSADINDVHANYNSNEHSLPHTDTQFTLPSFGINLQFVAQYSAIMSIYGHFLSSHHCHNSIDNDDGHYENRNPFSSPSKSSPSKSSSSSSLPLSREHTPVSGVQTQSDATRWRFYREFIHHRDCHDSADTGDVSETYDVDCGDNGSTNTDQHEYYYLIDQRGAFLTAAISGEVSTCSILSNNCRWVLTGKDRAHIQHAMTASLLTASATGRFYCRPDSGQQQATHTGCRNRGTKQSTSSTVLNDASRMKPCGQMVRGYLSKKAASGGRFMSKWQR